MDCHIIYPEIPPIVKVSKWINKKDVIDYYFVSSKLPEAIYIELDKITNKEPFDRNLLEKVFNNNIIYFEKSKKPIFIRESIYTDDSINNAVYKYCIFTDTLDANIFPYVWNDKPLRFNIQTSWDNYDLNPFNTSDTKLSKVSADTVFFEDKLLLIDSFNIILYDDFKKVFKNNNEIETHYFPNKKDKIKLNKNIIKGILTEQSILTKLWFQEKMYHESLTDKSTCILNKARFNASLNTNKSLKEIFNKLHTNKDIQFIQFIDDLNHIYYKVYKEHRIPEPFFDNWTNTDQLNGQSQIIIYSFIQELSLLYSQIIIDNKNNIHFTYKLDFSENITYDLIYKHINTVINYFKKYISIKNPNIQIENISMRTTVQIPDVNLKDISKFFTSLLPLYNVPSKNRVKQNILDLYFKRIPKYGQSTDIREYIKSKLYLGIPILDIFTDLQEYGIGENEVKEYIEEITQDKDTEAINRKKKDITNVGLIMHMSVIPFGIQISIENGSSIFDITNALAWTRSALILWYKEAKLSGIVSKSLKEQITEIEEDIIENKLNIIKPDSIPSDTESLLSLDSDGGRLSIGSDEQFGGAIGKEYNRYFSTLLKQADPNIFALTENYARKCQVVDLRQPIAISKEQKEYIDKSIYNNSYDNAIEYGSNPDKTNIYMCPRVWCPKSQVPLSKEQYDNGNGKCPLEDEEPMLLYKHATWYNDINRPHYVGFLKERGYNDVKLPCCFKREQVNNQKEEQASYIIDRIKNIPEKRLGTIPNSLHEFIYPNVPHKLCRNTVKTNECLLRYGVSNSADTFLTSIVFLLKLKSKSELIKYIQKNIDPSVFITLENGLVFQAFQPENPLLIEKEPKLKNKLLKWLEKYPQYSKLYNLEPVLSILKNNNIENYAKLSTRERFMISRQLVIMDSYNRFIEYLKEDNKKNPNMFFDLLHHLGFLTIIWNRDSDTLSTLKCPYAYKLKHWLHGYNNVLPCILLLNTEEVYEPLVIVDNKNKIKQSIYFTDYPNIEKLINQCPTFNTNDHIYIQKLYTLSIWTKNILSSPNKFVIDTIILDYNYKVHAFMTKGNIWIDIPDKLLLSSIYYLINILQIDKILYMEDIQDTLYDIRINQTEYALWSRKLSSIGFGSQIGELKKVSKIYMESIFKIPKIMYPDIPRIPITLVEPFIQNIDSIKYDNSKWYSIKKHILNKLINNYESLVKPLLNEPKKIRLEKLYQEFEHMNQPSRIAVLLEELPIKSKKHLEIEYNNLILEKPYYHSPYKVYEENRNKEWVFTQHIINSQELDFIKIPGIKYDKTIISDTSKEIINKKNIIDNPLPDMLDTSKCHMEVLSSKWKNTAIWKKYSILIPNSYEKDTLIELIKWIVNDNYLEWNIDDLNLYLRKQYLDMLEDKNNYKVLFDDLSIQNAWNKVLKRNYRTMNELINIGLSKLSVEEIKEKWSDILSKPELNSYLWTQDIDLYNISKLFRISFLIINKTNYIKNNNEPISYVKFVNGFEKESWKYRPVILLYKQKSQNNEYNIYSVIKKDNNINYYKYGKDLPKEILDLIKQFKQL